MYTNDEDRSTESCAIFELQMFYAEPRHLLASSNGYIYEVGVIVLFLFFDIAGNTHSVAPG